MRAKPRRTLVATVLVMLAMLLLQTVAPKVALATSGTYSETVGGDAHTWTNYTNAGGTQGPTIPAFNTVQIACALTGFRVADGNTSWYQIASAPWSYTFYVSADAFYNNGATSGSLHGTPWVDPAVPTCGSGSGTSETTGGEAQTWTNYSNAGGTQGPAIGGFATVQIACKLSGFAVANGNTWWYQIASSPWNNAFYVSADAFYNNGATSGSLRGTPFVDPAVPTCGSSSPGPTGPGETTGGTAHTWTDFSNAGGTQGPTIPANDTVQIACKVTGFRVANGNTWWYLISSSPWNSGYYVSSDAFYNNGAASGSLVGTPLVDPAVPDCSTGTRPGGETTGGSASTWANYSHAGGNQGQTIPAFTTIQVTCRVAGFAVANGNTWWYQIASSPWNDIYYVSADAFYNNGATSGNLVGTPFVDQAVPVCTNNQEQPIAGSAVGSANASVASSHCVSGNYPINCASGDFWHTFTDVSVSGRGPHLNLTRTYNDLRAATPGLFGNGWTSSYDQHLSVSTDDGSVTATLSDGSQMTAEPNGSGGFTVPSWADSSLQSNGDGTYTLTLHATQFLTFLGSGKLLSLRDPNGYQTTLAYDSSSNLTSVTDPAGRVLHIATGPNGDVASVVDPLGRTTTYGYSDGGDLTSVTDPLSRTSSFTYDGNHQMLTMTDPRGGAVSNTYDSQGRVTAQTDPAGLTTSYLYSPGDNFSSLGGSTTITDPHGNVEVKQYVNGFLTRLTKASGTAAQATWAYTYDPLTFGITSVTDPLGHVTTHTYDSDGQVLTTTDPLNHVTAATFNSLAEPLTTTSPLGKTTVKTYDANGNVLSVTDPLGNKTTYSYGDANHPGDVTSLTDPGGDVTSRAYDTYGDVASTSVSPSAGITDTTKSMYDSDGELVCQTSANATAAGVACPSPGGARVAFTTTTAYDADGEVTSSTDPNGHTSSHSYDADGNQTQATDPSGNVTTKSYDPDNRLLSTTSGANGTSPSTTRDAYDLAAGAGSCQTVASATYCNTSTNGRSVVTADYYDARGNEIDTVGPSGLTTQFTYDLDGNTLTKTDATGKVTTNQYDADGELVSVQYSDGTTPNLSYTYDADGHRELVSAGPGTLGYEYDADGRVIGIGGATTTYYSYDSRGNITKVTYPDGHVVTRNYDGANRMVSQADWVGHTTTFAYDPDGNVISTGYPNGDAVASSFDPTDSLYATKVGPTGTTLASITYGRNADGLITQAANSGGLSGTTKYSYNAQNELSAAGSTTFAYDPDGDPTSIGKTSQTFSATDEVTSSTNNGATTSDLYDNVGDRFFETPSSGTPTEYDYDQARRLTSVSQSVPPPTVTKVSPTSSGSPAGGTTVTITGKGLSGVAWVHFGTVSASFTAVSSTEITAVSPPQAAGTYHVFVSTRGGVSAGTTADLFVYKPATKTTVAAVPSQPSQGIIPVVAYTYDGTGLRASETTSTGTTSFAWDRVSSSVPLLLSDGAQDYVYGPDGLPIEQVDAAGNSNYFFHDSSGSTRALLASNGGVAATFTFSAFGAQTSSSGKVKTPLLYAQSYTDPVTGLLYLVNRYYDPSTAQFISVDPLAGTTGQPYAYAGDDPIDGRDPTGLFSFSRLRDDAEAAIAPLLDRTGAVLGMASTITDLSSNCDGVGSSAWDSVNCGQAIKRLGVGTVLGNVLPVLCLAAYKWCSAAGGTIAAELGATVLQNVPSNQGSGGDQYVPSSSGPQLDRRLFQNGQFHISPSAYIYSGRVCGYPSFLG